MRQLGLLLLPILFTGCASLTKVSKQNENLAKVKKVAIVGFSVSYQEPPRSKIGEIIHTAKMLSGADDAPKYGENENVDLLYQEFAEKIQKENSWHVLPVSQLAGLPKYKSLVKDTSEGLQLRPPLPQSMSVLRAHQIIDAGAFRMMKPEQKARLAKDLGVDAVLIVEIISSIEVEGGLKKYIGMAEFRPRAQVTVEMIDGKSDKPLWQDSWAWGTGDKAVQSTLSIANNTELMEQVKIAVRYGYSDLFGRYKIQ
jgi:hypothetical protein